jgi:hypothetical protein
VPVRDSGLSRVSFPAWLLHCLLANCVFFVALLALPSVACAQVLVIDARGNARTESTGAPVDRRFAQIQPTSVALPKVSLNSKSRLELIRALQSEQGFAMRPFPRGRKGLTLEANGLLQPAGESYLNMVTTAGLSAKPGDRLVLTDVKVEHNRIIFLLNGGPDRKHRFLRHIQIGTSAQMSSVVQDDGQEPVGARLALVFKNGVPDISGADVKALLAPLISFDLKTPVQAFTDTLPPMLRDAILSHRVLVGMSTDMVLFAKGQPERKIREMDGQMPFEEWIYGQPPKDVEFVRINGNRVIRVEIAKVGVPLQIFEKDVVEGMMRTDGSPLNPGDPTGIRTVQMGDVHRDPDRQAPDAPPSLRAPGETAPAGNTNHGLGEMRPVRFPEKGPNAQTEPAVPAPDAMPDKSAQPQATPSASQTTPATQPQ